MRRLRIILNFKLDISYELLAFGNSTHLCHPERSEGSKDCGLKHYYCHLERCEKCEALGETIKINYPRAKSATHAFSLFTIYPAASSCYPYAGVTLNLC
jgi:hypothetical protein